MEVRPHQEDPDKVVVTIENSVEDIITEDELPDISGTVNIGGVFYTFEGRQHKYPFEVEISRRSLGRVAGRGMMSRNSKGMKAAREILDYFESEPRPES